jgi:hypothetical protein
MGRCSRRQRGSVIVAEQVPVDEYFELAAAHVLTLLARLIRKLALKQKHQAQVAEELASDIGLTGQRLEDVASCVALILCSR